MTITVRLFAILRDRAGFSDIKLELPDGFHAQQAAEQLAIAYPSLSPLIAKIAYAVNQEYAPAETELHEGDELALIPPVSGG